jgi:hypothetical protein
MTMIALTLVCLFVGGGAVIALLVHRDTNVVPTGDDETAEVERRMAEWAKWMAEQGQTPSPGHELRARETIRLEVQNEKRLGLQIRRIGDSMGLTRSTGKDDAYVFLVKTRPPGELGIFSDDEVRRALELCRRPRLDSGPQQTAENRRVDVDVEDVRQLVADAKTRMRDAMNVEGGPRSTRLEQAKRACDQAAELIEHKRRSVPDPRARGPSFESLDALEQELNTIFVLVRRTLSEQPAASERRNPERPDETGTQPEDDSKTAALRGGLAKIETLLASEDYEGALAAVHELEPVAAQLGRGTDVADLVAKVETARKEHDARAQADSVLDQAIQALDKDDLASAQACIERAKGIAPSVPRLARVQGRLDKCKAAPRGLIFVEVDPDTGAGIYARRTPVSNAEYKAWLTSLPIGKRHPEPWLTGDFPLEQADAPVLRVKPVDASAFAESRNERLPNVTERAAIRRALGSGAQEGEADKNGFLMSGFRTVSGTEIGAEPSQGAVGTPKNVDPKAADAKPKQESKLLDYDEFLDGYNRIGQSGDMTQAQTDAARLEYLKRFDGKSCRYVGTLVEARNEQIPRWDGSRNVTVTQLRLDLRNERHTFNGAIATDKREIEKLSKAPKGSIITMDGKLHTTDQSYPLAVWEAHYAVSAPK